MYNFEENMAVSKAWIRANRHYLVKSGQNITGWDFDYKALSKSELLSVLNVESAYMNSYLDNQLVPVKHIVDPRFFTIRKTRYLRQNISSSSGSYSQNIRLEYNYSIRIALNYSQQQIKDIIRDETDKNIYIFCNSENYNRLSSVKIIHNVTPTHNSTGTSLLFGPTANVNIVTDLNGAPSTVYGTGGVLRWADNTMVPENYILNIPPLNINGDHTPRIIYEKIMKIGVYNPVRRVESRSGYSVKNAQLELRDANSNIITIHMYYMYVNDDNIQRTGPLNSIETGLELYHRLE